MAMLLNGAQCCGILGLNHGVSPTPPNIQPRLTFQTMADLLGSAPYGTEGPGSGSMYYYGLKIQMPPHMLFAPCFYASKKQRCLFTDA